MGVLTAQLASACDLRRPAEHIVGELGAGFATELDELRAHPVTHDATDALPGAGGLPSVRIRVS